MAQPYHRKYTADTPSLHQKERAGSDIQYTDIMFIYPVTLRQDKLGDQIKVSEGTPHPVECSFQDHALNSERNNYDRINSHYARIFTRYRDVIKWGDKIICKGVEMTCIKALPRFDNVTGEFHHTEIRATYDKQDGSVNIEPA